MLQKYLKALNFWIFSFWAFAGNGFAEFCCWFVIGQLKHITGLNEHYFLVIGRGQIVSL
jgi:hypothetical protein